MTIRQEFQPKGQSTYALIPAIKQCQAVQAEASEALFVHATNLAVNVNYLVAAARVALDVLENLTTEEFSEGGDRPARHALIEALGLVGAISEEEAKEYGVVRLV